MQSRRESGGEKRGIKKEELSRKLGRRLGKGCSGKGREKRR